MTPPSRRRCFRRSPPSSVRRPLPDWGHVHTELKRKGVTLQLLWLEYRERPSRRAGLQPVLQPLPARGARRSTSSCASTIEPARRCSSTSRACASRSMTALSGERAFEAELFVACLGASSYTYAEALRSQELVHWVAGNVHALEFFGGAPEICVPGQPALGGYPGEPLRARHQRHLPGVRRALLDGHRPGPALQATGQGQGRSRGAHGRALDHRRAAQPALHLTRRGERRHRGVRGVHQRPALQEDGRLAQRALRDPRPPGAAAPAHRCATGSPLGRRPR